MRIKIFAVLLVYLFSCHVFSSEIEDHPSWNYIPSDNCGNGVMADKIIGGKEASLGQFPWLARLGYRIHPTKKKIYYLCMGSIINQWYIITAAHCIENILEKTIYQVRLGENFVGTKVDCERDQCAPPTQDLKVNRIIKFKDYNVPPGTNNGDIGLIELDYPIEYNDYVMPICLPRSEVADYASKHFSLGTKYEVAGWGVVNSLTKKFSKKAMYVELPLVGLDVCKSIYLGKNIDESQLCIGSGRGKDSCVGDSGGPAMRPVAIDGPPKYYLFGLVSFGMKFCGHTAAVYTNVTHYMPWILDNIDK